MIREGRLRSQAGAQGPLCLLQPDAAAHRSIAPTKHSGIFVVPAKVRGTLLSGCRLQQSRLGMLVGIPGSSVGSLLLQVPSVNWSVRSVDLSGRGMMKNAKRVDWLLLRTVKAIGPFAELVFALMVLVFFAMVTGGLLYVGWIATQTLVSLVW